MNRKKIYDALVELGIHPDCINPAVLEEEILRHMERGLQGEEGSMMMIPAYLFADGEIVKGETVAVIDAGGTNLRAAKVMFGEDGPEILELRKSRMPGTENPVTAEEMYDEFVRRIMPLMPDSGRLVLCFSYAFESLPDGEARIITMGKEVAVEGSEGSLIRSGMEKAFSRAGHPGPVRVMVLNDTAAVLYSALVSGNRNAIGFILGTGMNSAYFEKTANITKIPAVPQEQMAVNMESAYFSDVPSGTVDRKLDEHSRNKGKALLEKMVSGAYLGEISRLGAVELCSRGLCSDRMSERLGTTEIVAKDMTEFLEHRTGSCADLCADENDGAVLEMLFRAVEERAGRLVGSLIAAVVTRIRRNGGEGPVDIAVDGSTILLNRIISDEFRKTLDGSSAEIPDTGWSRRTTTR